MIDIHELPSKYIAYTARWAERNKRMDEIVEAVNGIFDVDGPDDDQIENRSPNFVQVALEDTAETASLIPTVRVQPSGTTPAAKKKAAAMDRMAMSYLDLSQIELLTPHSMLSLAAHGFFSWIVYDDPETGSPVVQLRDPRTCFPEPGWKTLDSTRTVFFARDLYVDQLPNTEEQPWKAIVDANWPSQYSEGTLVYTSRKVVLVEYFEEDEWIIVALYQINNRQGMTTDAIYQPIELTRGKNPSTSKGGVCPVVLGQRITLDGEPHGQFDQVVGIQKAHIRLMGMMLDWSDQAVYSDVWVKDLIGPLNTGGGAYIQLGPNGAIGRVPPATSDITVFRDLEQLVDSMHLAGRWPKTRPGEIDQAIASAKFVEATAGVMNTVIRTYHLVMKRALEQALRLCFVIDSQGPHTRTISGVLRNQQFLEDRDREDIDLDAKVRVDYGLGLGHDPAQAMVLGIQAKQAGFVSSQFVQENFEGITDVTLERQRIDTERLRDMAFARLLQGFEQGSIPDSALPEIARARQNGDDIFELFDKFVVQPAEEAQSQQLTSGEDGSPIQPGPVPQGNAPAAPPVDAVLAGILGGGGGGPEPESASRLNVPLGNGSFASSNLG